MSKTIFVIGAGASCELGLPLGDDLRKIIAAKLRLTQKGQTSDEFLRNALHMLARSKIENITSDVASLQRKSNLIARAMPLAKSIDNYLHDHFDDIEIVTIGKMAIASSILDGERQSPIFIDKRYGNRQRKEMDYTRLSNSWFPGLFQFMTDQCKQEDLPERFRKFAFVIFNYDRCIEHFLFESLKTYYPSLSTQGATEIVKELALYHPYGKVGRLPWQVEEDGIGIEFGADIETQEVIDISNQILTFTESSTIAYDQLEEIQTCIDNTSKVVFMGFGFIPLNLELIIPLARNSKRNRTASFRCLATMKGVSEQNRAHYIDALNKRLRTSPEKILANDLGCKEFIDSYSVEIEQNA
jgi:hypothetical protein